MKVKILFIAIFISTIAIAQETKQDSLRVVNRLLSEYNSNRLTIGGYAQIDYNEPDGSEAGNLDVHRLVMLFGYKFTDKISFLTEIELEHVKEVYVEQAFINYNVNPNFNIKGGLMLIPMGIVNEYHEPPTFYGVERPGVDHDIVPTTWREIGVGVSGKFDNLSLKYQAYIFNGFVSYRDGEGTLRGKDGLRKGRQKAAESIINSPNLSTVGVSMVGFDARYRMQNLELRGQYIFTSLSGTEDYNDLTGKDLGSKMDGLYGEVAYNIMPLINKKTEKKLALFTRYEKFNTQKKTEGDLKPNKEYDRDIITSGIDFKLTSGVAIKADYQWFGNAATEDNSTNQFNAGIGIMF